MNSNAAMDVASTTIVVVMAAMIAVTAATRATVHKLTAELASSCAAAASVLPIIDSAIDESIVVMAPMKELRIVVSIY